MRKTTSILITFIIVLSIVLSCISMVFADDYFTDYVFLYEPDNTTCEKIIVEEEYDQIESGDKLAYKYEYAYNDKGLRTAETFYRDNDEGTLDLIRQKTYEYDDMDRITKACYYDIENGNSKLILTILYTYTPESDGGYSREALRYLHEEGRDVVIEKENSVYDNEGRCIHSLYFVLNDEEEMYLQVSNDTIIEGNQETTISYDFLEDGTVTFAYKGTYEYDENGKCIRYIEYDYDAENEEFIGGTESNITYDENGRVLKDVRTDIESGSIITTDIHTYEYYPNGNMSKDIYESIPGEKAREYDYYFKVEYTYDELGNCIELIEYTYDDKFTHDDNDTLIADMTQLSVYDERGVLISEKTTAKFGDEGDINMLVLYTSELKHIALEKVEGKKATIKEAGYNEYYYCDECKHYYEDEEGQHPIADLSAWQQNEGKVEYKMPTTTIIIIICFALIIFRIVTTEIKAAKQRKQAQ